MDYVFIAFAGLGFSVVMCGVAIVLAEVLRAAYWSIWTLYPVSRANPDKVTVMNCLQYVWQCFVSELGSDYDTRSIAGVYSHGLYPWSDRSWFV